VRAGLRLLPLRRLRRGALVTCRTCKRAAPQTERRTLVPKRRKYVYPGPRSYVFVGSGPWHVYIRDSKGRRMKWRASMSYNQARASMVAARNAGYRDPQIER
jgi:hypothetical protein